MPNNVNLIFSKTIIFIYKKKILKLIELNYLILLIKKFIN